MHAHNERGPRGHSQDRASPSVALKRCPSMASRSRLCGFCLVRVQCTRSCRATAILLLLICGARYHGMERTTSVGPSPQELRINPLLTLIKDLERTDHAVGSPYPEMWKRTGGGTAKFPSADAIEEALRHFRIDILIGLYFSNPNLSRVDAFHLSSTARDRSRQPAFACRRGSSRLMCWPSHSPSD